MATGAGDGSNTSNFCTLRYANNNLSAGDRAILYDNRGLIHERIEPARNGTSALPIVYMAGIGETPVISTPDNVDNDDKRSAIAIIGSTGNEKSYITVRGINATTKNDGGGQRFFTVSWANHILFENCTFKTPVFSGGNDISDVNYAMSNVKYSSYITFLNCEWDAATTPIDSNTQHDLLFIQGVSHSLWKNCTFGDCSHTPFRNEGGSGGEDFIAVIDCTFTNKWRRAYEFLADDYEPKPTRWLVQGNTLIRTGWDNANCPWHKDRNRLSNSKLDSINLIYRENISYGCDTGLSNFSKALTDTPSNNYIYHNTWYNNKKGIGNTQGGVGWFSQNLEVGFKDNVIINNIFWDYDGDLNKDSEYQVAVGASRDKPLPVGNTIAFNSFGRNRTTLETYIRWSGTTGSLTKIEAGESEWHDNILADPGFVDPDNLDFTPTNPELADAATHLTRTNGSGSNSSKLIVDNASYFFSGPNSPWFLENTVPDTIYVEGAGAVQISSINYATNTIVLSKNMTWQDNKRVYHRPFAGSGPDIGAVEKMGPSSTMVEIKEYKQ